MDLRDLRYFLAVVETRNLSRAARQARVAQPALSRLIRLLERELGIPLLQRHPKGVSLTPAGDGFAAGATQLLGDVAAAFDRAEATAAGRRGRVVLSALRAVIARGFPSALHESLRADHPEIALVVRDFDPPDTWKVVADGRADVGVSIEDAPQAGLVWEALWVEALDHAIVPRNHVLASRGSITVSELGILPMVVAQQTLGRSQLEGLVDRIRAAGLRSPILALEGDLRSAHIAVAAGRGWTLIARTRAQAPPEGTVALRIVGLEASARVAAVWRRTERRPVVQTVLRRMFEIAGAMPESAVRPDAALPAVPRATRSRRPVGTVPAAVELRHLRALVAVASTRTIGRAAERLGLSQPALSRQLRELEHEAGSLLLERSPRGVTLTAAGASLADDAPALLAMAQRLVRDASRAKRGMEGRVVIGAVATGPTSELLSRAITRSAVRYPQVHLLVQEMPTPAQHAALAAGDIDLGLAHAFPTIGHDKPEGIVATRVHEDRLDAALLPAEHALAGRRHIEAHALAAVPFLFMDRAFHPGFYDRVYAELRTAGLEPLIDQTYDGLQAVWSLVAQGKGWALGFHSQLERPPAGTVAVRVSRFDLPWGIDLLSRRGETSLAVRAVIEIFREVRASQPRSARRASSVGLRSRRSRLRSR
jgi:DNA-binding transcriptional LysR family regulator